MKYSRLTQEHESYDGYVKIRAKDLNHSNYYIAVKEEKGYILRNLKNLSFGWTGHWPSLDVLRDSITTPIQIFSKDEYELVLRKKKKML